MSQKPYIIREVVRTVREYNPEYGDERICECGHSYARHFDSWEDMEPVGCKYCDCHEFVEIEEGKETIEEAACRGYDDGKAGKEYNNCYATFGSECRWHEAYKTRFEWGQDTRRDLGND